MKKICLLLCAAIFFAMPCMEEKYGRNYIFKADFSDYSDDEDAIAYLTKKGFTTSLTAAMGDKVEIKDGALFVDRTERTQGYPSIEILKSYTYDNDVVCFEYDLKPIGRVDSYQFPQFGVIAQTWMLPGDSTIDVAVTDVSVTSGSKWKRASKLLTWGENAQWYHFKYIVDAGTSKMSVWVSGGAEFTAENVPIISGTDIPKVLFNFRGGSCMMDNIEYYTMNKMRIKTSSVADGDENVPCEQPIDIEFSERIDENSLSGIAVSGLDADGYTTELPNDSTVRISFKKPLAYGSEYTINAESVKAKNGLSADNAIIKFTTEATPELYIKNVDEAADGDLKTVSVTIANTAAESRNITLFMAVYDEYNSLVKMNYVSCEAGAESEKTVGLSQKISGGTVKLYLWNGAELMQPYCAEYTADFTEVN